MNIRHILPLLMFLGCLVGGEPAPAERNAALQYWIAFSSLPEKEPTWLATMRAKPDGAVDPAAEQADSTALRYLHVGAGCAEGTFGSIVACESFGPGALLPHLGSARLLARLALARATWRFEHGRSAEALADSLAVVALSADLSNGATLIELLVAISIRNQALTTIARHLPTCGPDERVGLAARLSAPRMRLYRDIARSEAAIWHQLTAQPEEFVRAAQRQARDAVDESSAIPADLVAAVQARDPQVAVWSREAEAWLAGSVAMIDLTAEDFRAQRARLEEAPHANPLLRTNLGAVLSLIEMQRAVAVRSELLGVAAQALDQPGGLQALGGRPTLEGAATVTVQGGITTVQVVRPGKAKPIELIIGRAPTVGGF